MQYNEDEKKAIRIIAKWFRENKGVVTREDAIKDFNVDGNKYEALIRMMEHDGIVEKVNTDMRNGYASSFRPSPHAEELAREFDEEDEIIRDELIKAFNVFLRKKHFPEKVISQDQLFDLEKPSPDIALLDRESNDVLALVEFSTRSQSKDSLRKIAKEYLSEIPSADNLKYYIVEMGGMDFPEQFKIFLLSKEEGVKQISMADFPTYEEMRNVIKEKRKDSDERKLCLDFTVFLNKKKGYNRSSMKYGSRGNNSWIDLEIIDRVNNKQLAVIEFGLRVDYLTIQKAKNQLMEFNGDAAPPAMAYAVFPDEAGLGDDFTIVEIGENDENPEISESQFPTFDMLKFIHGLDLRKREFCRKLLERAKSEVELKVIVSGGGSYINLKAWGRTVAQLHRVADESNYVLGLALAGYSKEFSPSDTPGIWYGEDAVLSLSGFKSGIQPEINWLNGKVGHPRLKYKAGVYLFEITGEVENYVMFEVIRLLGLAKETAKSRKGEPEPKEPDGEALQVGLEDLSTVADRPERPPVVSDVVGEIATMRIDGVGGKDRLGRERLVKALAGTFVHTKYDNGFTLALMGDWGQGKSMIIDLLEKELKNNKSPKFEFATYNAWEYENTDNVPAGIAQEVVKGLMDKVGSWKTICLQIEFALKEHRQDLAYVLFYVLLAVNIPLWGIPLINRFDFFEGFVRELLGISGAIGVGALVIYSLKVLKQVLEHPIAFKMQTYLKLPDYGEHLGLLPVLKGHIDRLCSLRLGEDGKFIVFVDDLDRCQWGHIAKVLDAIRLVMKVPNVIVMICIDHRIAFKAVEKHYRLLADKEDGNRRSSAEIARDYLGKIIQLPIRLMPATHDELEDYVKDKLFADAVEPPMGVPVPEPDLEPYPEPEPSPEPDPEPEPEPSPEPELTTEPDPDIKDEPVVIEDTTEEQDEFYRLMGKELFGFSNPRQLLRLHNSFRFLKALGRGAGRGRSTLDLLKMLFWQEFLHNWPMKIRGWCMAALVKEEHVAKIEASDAKKVLENVREEIAELFNKEGYQELAKFVRVVVLPHNEEGVLDSKEDIKNWMTEEERKRKEKKATP